MANGNNPSDSSHLFHGASPDKFNALVKILLAGEAFSQWQEAVHMASRKITHWRLSHVPRPNWNAAINTVCNKILRTGWIYLIMFMITKAFTNIPYTEHLLVNLHTARCRSYSLFEKVALANVEVAVAIVWVKEVWTLWITTMNIFISLNSYWFFSDSTQSAYAIY